MDWVGRGCMTDINSLIETLENLKRGYSNDLNAIAELNSSDDSVVELISNYLAQMSVEHKRLIEALKGLE